MENVKKTRNRLTSLQSQHQETSTELRRYKLLVESVQDYAIFFMDKNGYIQTWNKGAEKNKGYSAEEIIGKNFSSFYRQVDKNNKKPQRELEIAARDGRVEDEGWRVRKDGSMFWANVVITALYNSAGELVGFAKVTRNLTERKKQEDKLRRANSKLLKQKKELQILSASKDEFISLASHQLRTPATAVKQYLGILLGGMVGKLSPQQHEITSKAYDSNERQLAIVTSLLNVAQIDSARMVLRKSWVDVNTLLKELIDEQTASISAKKQMITLRPLDSPLQIYVDHQYLGMAISNIIDNASKYSHANGKIEVSAERIGKKLNISIKDNGVGLESTDLNHMFEKFKRIPNKLSHVNTGSGLGLYWTQKVVELHNGEINVNSKVGEGTTFNLILKAGKKDA